MADSAQFSFVLFLLLSSLLHVTVSIDPPQISPSLSPTSPAVSPSPVPMPSPAPSIHAPNSAPAGSPLGLSPPAPSPTNPSPASSPSPSPSPSPAPVPADGSVVSHADLSDAEDEADSSSGGMNAGKKAGLAIGVIVAAGVVVLAAMVYKRRQQNIRRSQYGYAARREIL